LIEEGWQSVTEPSLADMVKQAQKGDRGAFEQIVRATARMVYAQVVATVRDRQRAEDLTQETFIAAWKALSTIKDASGFNSWLLTIARNTTLDAIKFEARKKRAAKSATGEAADDLADDTPSPPEHLESAEAANRALQLLEELPEDYRRPLMLRYLGGADYETIRQQLDLTDGALRGLLNRGMAMLRERMTRGHHDQPSAKH
jgi:RNA polymerase sigma-70 factor (ECF subfamily)